VSAALALSFGATASSRSARRSRSADRSMARSAARLCGKRTFRTRYLPDGRPADLAETGTDSALTAISTRHRPRQGCRRRAVERPGRWRGWSSVRRSLPAERGDLSEGERGQKFSGHSLRAGLASSAEVDESFILATLRGKTGWRKNWRGRKVLQRRLKSSCAA
jgi:hypothetical protein